MTIECVSLRVSSIRMLTVGRATVADPDAVNPDGRLCGARVRVVADTPTSEYVPAFVPVRTTCMPTVKPSVTQLPPASARTIVSFPVTALPERVKVKVRVTFVAFGSTLFRVSVIVFPLTVEIVKLPVTPAIVIGCPATSPLVPVRSSPEVRMIWSPPDAFRIRSPWMLMFADFAGVSAMWLVLVDRDVDRAPIDGRAAGGREAGRERLRRDLEVRRRDAGQRVGPRVRAGDGDHLARREAVARPASAGADDRVVAARRSCSRRA